MNARREAPARRKMDLQLLTLVDLRRRFFVVARHTLRIHSILVRFHREISFGQERQIRDEQLVAGSRSPIGVVATGRPKLWPDAR